MSQDRLLVMEIRFHDGRYHGQDRGQREWPPSPARLFQALVAGGARGGRLEDDAETALRWLEEQPPPLIAAPRAWPGKEVTFFVPNNDLDGKGGDPSEVAEIRIPKRVHPSLFDAAESFLYGWPLADGEPHLPTLSKLAERLYQLGRGVDLAWARVRLLDRASFDELVAARIGALFRPTPGAAAPERRLLVPVPGTLESLRRRHQATLDRFGASRLGKKRIRTFTQPPKPILESVAYDGTATRVLFDLRGERDAFAPQPLATIVGLTERIRDAAARRLIEAAPELEAEVERALVGRTPEGMPRLDPSDRVRLTPLPSIGHEQTTPAIRRLLAEIPASCPLRPADVLWALSGLVLPSVHGRDGETAPVFELTRAVELTMLHHYGVGDAARRARRWLTVTPAALPAPRRRLSPEPPFDALKGGDERQREEVRAVAAVRQALRHAGVVQHPNAIDVQREPFLKRGRRAEEFAAGTRFDKHRLWHVALTFDEPCPGPLVLGDGRFLGLGLMAPDRAQRGEGVIAFRVLDGWSATTDPEKVALALRRAIMARCQARMPNEALPPFVTGHRHDGGPDQERRHLHTVCDPTTKTLLLVPPHLVDHREHPTRPEREGMRLVWEAVRDMRALVAGRSGKLLLEPAHLELPSARRWRSSTPYVVNRHKRSTSARTVVREDVLAACAAAHLPRPEVIVDDLRGVSGAGLTATVRLQFAVAVAGPIALGRTRFKGGGWFVPVAEGEGDPE
ncbi:MAG TPA: type I-U CRISPR-associated protein Cas5/Cas6 [Polyangiaceae bacterium]|nr:type I-U CRISPR-associated protein Cas5/Cas6 [Polyangiaceae bacterium]